MTEIEDEINITIQTSYQSADSDLQKDRYAFSYQVKIENHSDYTVTLRKRNWQIVDAHGKTERVHTLTPLEDQPILMPKEVYEYQSGTFLTTPFGTMDGWCEFENDLGRRFRVEVPSLALTADITWQ